MLNKETIRDVLKIALPAVGEMILYMMIWVFDTMMVGQYSGNIGVSAVGLSSEIMYTFVNIFIAVGISVGITSMVARKCGANEINLAEEYATYGFAMGLCLSILISIITFLLSNRILSLAGATGNVLLQGTIFMKITSFGIFFNMLSSMLNALLRGNKNTKTPLIVSVLINIINLSLDYLLIFGKFGFPELGVKGSAIATTSAQIIGFIFLVIYIKNKSTIKLRTKYLNKFNTTRIYEIVKLSIPSSMQEGAFDVSRLLSTFMIMYLGTVSFASNQIATTLESLSFMPGWGFGIAATTLVGHKIGEKDYKKAREYANTCTVIGASLMILCSILFLTCPTLLIGLFINESEKDVIRIGSQCLRIASIEQPFMALSMIFGGALKGSGNTKIPFIISFISSWGIRIPLMLYFIYYLKFPVTYVWWITAIQWTFDGLVMTHMFRKTTLQK